MSLRHAYGYLSLPRHTALDAEQRVRGSILEYGRIEGLELQHLFVDRREDDAAYAFDALRFVLGRRADVEIVVLPDLGHVAHIPLVADMSATELGRFLGCPVRLVDPPPPPPAPPPPSPPPQLLPQPRARPLAIGLVHRPAGSPSSERRWGRALVIRHAHDAQLQLIDVLELHDEPGRTRGVLSRLGDLAASPGVTVLVTDGLDADLARRLAHDLGLVHQAVPPA
jgi:hypothetical protein